MDTIKTTVVFQKDLWEEFQKIAGKKKTSQILSKITKKLVQHYNAQKLIQQKADQTWDDSYLDECLKKEIQFIQKDLLSSK